MQSSATSANEVSPYLSVASCYACGKCTAGCPIAAQMDLAPNRVFRLVQMGEVEVAASSDAIWYCVACYTCETRCPQSVNCVAVMDALREKALTEDLVPQHARRVVAFQRSFLENIRRYGRLYELDLIARFKLAGFRCDHSIKALFADATLAPKMQKREKLHLHGEPVSDRGVVERIFARCGFDAHPEEEATP